MVEFAVLGSLEVSRDGEPVSLSGGKQRALLAILLLRRNEVVSVDRLVEELWRDRPPPTAAKIVQLWVSQLRKVLGDGVLVTRSPGYVLIVGHAALDATRFEQLVTEGRRLLADDAADLAGQRLREALSLWRGPPLADFAYEGFAQGEIARLEELRLAALEERIDADLALGRHREIVGELEALVSEHPLRERLRSQHMLALYRSGRQAEALESYQAARRVLNHDLGLEPSRALQELEHGILRQDSSLSPPPVSRLAAVVPPRLLRRSPSLLLIGATLLGAGIAAGAIELNRGTHMPAVPPTGSFVAAVDLKTGRIAA